VAGEVGNLTRAAAPGGCRAPALVLARVQARIE
jgi:hypothetical protein